MKKAIGFTIATALVVAAFSEYGSLNANAASVSKKASSPIVINFYSVAGTDQFYQGMLIPMFEKATGGKYIVNYGRGNWQDIVNKIKAEGNNVSIDVVASGIDGVPGGAKAGVWTKLIPQYSKQVGYNNLTDLGKAYVKAYNGYGVPLEVTLSGPDLAYNASAVPNPPTTFAALKSWISSHPNKFQYATVPTSGPGRGFFFGVVQSQGENPNSINNLGKTWNYLKQIGNNISAYPSSTSDTFTVLNNGTVDIIPHMPGWFATLYAQGQIPPNVKLVPMKGVKQIIDSQFYCIPKGLSKTQMNAALTFVHFAMSAQADAQIYTQMYLPTNKFSNVNMLSGTNKQQYLTGLKAIPSEFKKGNQLIVPKNDWILFPPTNTLLYEYNTWTQMIQGAK